MFQLKEYFPTIFFFLSKLNNSPTSKETENLRLWKSNVEKQNRKKIPGRLFYCKWDGAKVKEKGKLWFVVFTILFHLKYQPFVSFLAVLCVLFTHRHTCTQTEANVVAEINCVHEEEKSNGKKELHSTGERRTNNKKNFFVFVFK